MTKAGVLTKADVFAGLREFLGDRVSDAPGMLAQFGRSEAYHHPAPPDLVARPETTADVQRIVSLCRDAAMPVVAYGAGTSLEGNALALRGGLCVDMSAMDKVLEVHQGDMDVRVQPGLRRKALNAQLRDTGLFFPIDPGADASVGGMTSTRGSGTMAIRYGTMRENVLALEVVLADGRAIRTARRARKSAAGYDLTRLFTGAEGTLGIITEVTLRLHPVPEAISAAVCAFPDFTDAVETVIEVIQNAIPVARIELLDEVMMRGINAHAGFSYRETPTLFLEFHGSANAVAEQAKAVEAIAADHGGLGFEWASRAEDRSRLWHARDNTLYAARALAPGRQPMITDVCVPISALAECLTATRRDIQDSGLLAPVVGHVGDGNFHTLIMFDPADPASHAAAIALQNRMVARALALDGTCTGEHGIGSGKIGFLEEELGDAVDAMRAIKLALDPLGLMNPGKIFRMPGRNA